LFSIPLIVLIAEIISQLYFIDHLKDCFRRLPAPFFWDK
jgi:hypothetical protein